MKKSWLETMLYLIVGVVMFLGYYLLMTKYFKLSPFRGYSLIPTVYLAICYVLFPTAGKRMNEKIEEYAKNNSLVGVLSAKTKMIISFVFGPFILIFTKD